MAGQVALKMQESKSLSEVEIMVEEQPPLSIKNHGIGNLSFEWKDCRAGRIVRP